MVSTPAEIHTAPSAPTTSRSSPVPWQTLVHGKQRAVEALERELTQLWGHISAAEYRFLELLAAFDRCEGWGQYGCHSCAHWLNWRCGIGAVAARERVRVARALEALPNISEAFRGARISYSKVRAMTRIATPDNEPELLNIALHGTASHMERLVRKYRWVERLEAARRANGVHQARYACFRYDEDGSVTLRAKLPPEVALVVQRALRAAMDTLRKAEAEAEADEVETESNVSAETDGIREGLPTNEAASSDAATAADSDSAVAAETGSNVSAETRPAGEVSPAAEASPSAEASPEVLRHAASLEDAQDGFGARMADAVVHLAERFLHGRRQETGSALGWHQHGLRMGGGNVAHDSRPAVGGGLLGRFMQGSVSPGAQ